MMSHPSSRYTDDERIAIEGWLRDGYSAGRIAQEFIRKFQRYVSRNAMIGVIHRDPVLAKIGLPGNAPRTAGTQKDGRKHATPKLRERVRAQRPAAAKPVADLPSAMAPGVRRSKSQIVGSPQDAAHPAPPTFVNFAAYDASSLRQTLTEVEGCKFAVNDAAPGEEHLFCGHAKAPGSPYCPHHSTRAFNGVVSEAMRRGDIFRQRRIA